MKAIILAAGKGTRLFPLTLDTPKPLIKINDVPVIDYVFKSLPDEILEVIIVVEHLKEKIIDYVGNVFFGRKVKYFNQSYMKGTFGALMCAKDSFLSGERFMVLNGDDIYDKEELERYLKFQRSFGIQKIKMPKYHSIHLDNDGSILGFYPQTEEEQQNGALIATGSYLIDTKIFDSQGVILSDGEYGLPQTILSQKDKYPSKGIITTKWIPINSFDDIEKAEAVLKNQRGVEESDSR